MVFSNISKIVLNNSSFSVKNCCLGSSKAIKFTRTSLSSRLVSSSILPVRTMWTVLNRTVKKGYEFSIHRAKLLHATRITKQERSITQAQLQEVEKLTNTRVAIANDPKKSEFGHYVLESTTSTTTADAVITHSKKVDGQDTSFGSQKDLHGNTMDGYQMLAYKAAKSNSTRNLSISEKNSVDTEVCRRLCAIRDIREKNPLEYERLERYIRRALDTGYKNNNLDEAVKKIERIMDKTIKQHFYEFKEPL